MRGILVGLGMAGLVLAAGCSSLKDREEGRDSWAAGYGVKSLTLDANGAAMKLRAAIQMNRKTDPPTGLVDEACFRAPVEISKKADCMQQRNAALATLLVASDDLCQEHLKTIYGNDAYANIVTGTVATFFSGAAAIAGSGSAKSALAAISTFASAERSLLNETVYKNMLVTATTKKIRETRDAKAAALLPGGFKKDIEDYPMLLAVRDVVDYHYSCSFMLGLEKALEEGTQPGSEGKKAKFELEKRSLEMYIASQTAVLRASRPDITTALIDADKGIAGATARIDAIEGQLLALVRAQAPADASTMTKDAIEVKAAADRAALDKARAEAEKAQADAERSKAELEKAKAEMVKAQAETTRAQAEASKFQADAAKAWAEADKARAEAKKAVENVPAPATGSTTTDVPAPKN